VVGVLAWASAQALVPSFGGLVVLAGFVQLQRRDGDTLIDLELFRSKAFTWGAVLASIVTFALFGLMFTLPQFFQAVEGADALGTGLRLLPLIGGMMVGVKISPRLLPRLGDSKLIALGFAIAAAALFVGATTGVHDGYGFVAAWMAVGGAGVGFAMPTTMNAAINVLSPDRAGVGSGLLMTVRQIGGTVSVAVLGTLLNSSYRSHVSTGGLPPQTADAVRRSAGGGVAVAVQQHSTTLLASVRSALVHATSLTMIASACFALLGVLVTGLLPRGRAVADADADDVGDDAPQPAESSGDLLNAAE
jgi:predicted MFS family arabinose efflux permease